MKYTAATYPYLRLALQWGETAPQFENIAMVTSGTAEPSWRAIRAPQETFNEQTKGSTDHFFAETSVFSWNASTCLLQRGL